MDPGDHWIRCLRRLHHVPRWGTVVTIRSESVAEHSFGVACAVLWLAERGEPWSKQECLGALPLALRHDEREAISGDMPAPFKRRHPINSFRDDPDCPSLPVQRNIVGCADRLDALAFMWQERELGNNMLKGIVNLMAKEFASLWGEELLIDWSSVIDQSIHPVLESCPYDVVT